MEEETVELLTDRELETFLSDSHLADFMREVKKYPEPTARKNMSLVKKYKKYKTDCPGKIAVQNELIERNLRLIVSIAHKKVRYATSYNVLDLVNEGTIGFITAINKFNLEYGTKLSTYVVPWIRQAMDRALDNNDKLVRRPVHFEDCMPKYRKIVETYRSAGLPLPEDEELAEMLNVTVETVKMMSHDYKLDATSMESKVGDSEDTELGDFLGHEDDGYKSVLNSMVDMEICMMLKSLLSTRDYYILYHRILSSEAVTLQDVASQIGVSRERVRQVESANLRKLERIFENRSKYSSIMRNVRGDYNLEISNPYPVSPGDIAFFFFIREDLTSEERALYKLLIFRMENNPHQYYASRLGLELDDFEMVYASLNYKIKRKKDGIYKDAFESFKAKFIEEFKSNLFDLDLDRPLPPLYKSIVEHWNNVILEEMSNAVYKVDSMDESHGLSHKMSVSREVNRLLREAGDSLSPQIKTLIRRYFTFVLESPIPMEKAEKELNVVVNGYRSHAKLPNSVLYETLLANKSSFTDEQFDYICTYAFNRMTKRDFKAKYPESKVGESFYALMFKLEKLYFKPAKEGTFNFTREKYEAIREKCLKRGLISECEVLDLFFGIGGEACSIYQIADAKEVDYLVAHDMVRKARERCLACYLDRSKYKIIDEELYLPYLMDEEYELSERGRRFAIEHFVQGKTYKEIGEPLGLKSNVVSNSVNDVLRQIDYYRFGITSRANRYSKDVIEKVLHSHLFDDYGREILQYALETRDYKLTAEKFGITRDDVKKLTKKLFNRCYDVTIEDVHVTIAMIVEELNRHVSETILREPERIVLSHLCGVVCDANPTGEVLDSAGIKEKFGYSVEEYSRYKACGIKSIAARKCGLEKPSLAFMERSKVDALLKNPCLPISTKEREMLLYYFGLQGYPRKSIKELMVMYNCIEGSIRRRIQRAFVALFKYELGELDGVVNFEEHVLPNLKYFPKSDQTILVALYRDGVSQAEIARRLSVSRDSIADRVFRLQVYLKNILSGEENLFDYDYFEEHVMDEDVPFYGDKDLAYRMWWMCFEEKKTIVEIIVELDLPIQTTSVSRDMDTLMCAVLKKRMGIKKCREFSYEEIREYYLSHQSEMPFIHKEYYYRYFKRKEKWEYRHAPRLTSDVSIEITFDLLKDRGDEYFSLDSLTREKALELMRKYRHELSKDCLNALACKFKIQGKDFMSGSNQNKVIRALSYIETKPKVLVLRKKMSPS